MICVEDKVKIGRNHYPHHETKLQQVARVSIVIQNFFDLTTTWHWTRPCATRLVNKCPVMTPIRRSLQETFTVKMLYFILIQMYFITCGTQVL